MPQNALDRRAVEQLGSPTTEYADLVSEVTIPKVVDTDATTANPNAANIPFPVTRTIEVLGAYYTQAASTANDVSNYATVTLAKYTLASLGTVSTTVATLATSTAANSISARVGRALTVVPSTARCVAGDVLHVVAAKSGTGVSLSLGMVTVRYRGID